MTLPAATIEKLGKLFPRLATNHDGEVIATVRAIIRTLESSGASLHDLGPGLKTKTVEKIVYRDRPAEAPSAKAPGFQLVDDWKKIVELAKILITQRELNDREAGFVWQIHDKAKQFKTRFGMTLKQREWWEFLLADYDVPDWRSK